MCVALAVGGCDRDAAPASSPSASAPSQVASSTKDARRPDLKERVADAIDHGTRYLVEACNSQGKFKYRIDLDSKRKPHRKYNVLRHAGAMYALSMSYRRKPDPAVAAALTRAAEFLDRESLGKVPGHPDLIAAWSRSELTNAKAPLQAKLGGAGLGLVALTAVEGVAKGTTAAPKMLGLARFIMYMQRPNGSFFSKYIPSKGGRRADWVSLYYPGEAALGLLMYDDLVGHAPSRKAAKQALEYLAKRRRGRREVAPDHWAMIATALLWKKEPQSASPRLKVHARQVARSLLGDEPAERLMPEHVGSFGSDGRTTPAATRLEGLLAIRGGLQSEKKLARRIDRVARGGIEFLLRAQVASGDHVGAVPRAISRLPRDHRLAIPSFNRRASEVRIDYVQHALSAMIVFERLLASDSAKAP